MWRMTKVMSSDCDMNVVKTECNESLSNGMQAKQCETPRPLPFSLNSMKLMELIEFHSTSINGRRGCKQWKGPFHYTQFNEIE